MTPLSPETQDKPRHARQAQTQNPDTYIFLLLPEPPPFLTLLPNAHSPSAAEFASSIDGWDDRGETVVLFAKGGSVAWRGGSPLHPMNESPNWNQTPLRWDEADLTLISTLTLTLTPRVSNSLEHSAAPAPAYLPRFEFVSNLTAGRQEIPFRTALPNLGKYYHSNCRARVGRPGRPHRAPYSKTQSEANCLRRPDPMHSDARRSAGRSIAINISDGRRAFESIWELREPAPIEVGDDRYLTAAPADQHNFGGRQCRHQLLGSRPVAK
ncbi:hypothetical protein FB451DRAFT_1170961 [Mycena latifolia]|nr:hypothetical protein FB451DRAFT_1170961 [Mycena latifolia]